MTRAIPLALLAACLPLPLAAAAAPSPDSSVSYYRDVRPLFQQHCQGCHQPAQPKGGYVMTAHDALLRAGDSEKPGVVPGKPTSSKVIEQITAHDGKPPAMPRGKPPLADKEVDTIRRWIAQGAKDDTPASARQAVVDADHPPTYNLPPVITALDYSPDGTLLAVAGFHEVLLHKADGSKLIARLIGLSERIQSLAFSPDGRFLAVSGGAPGRFGEVQVWELRYKTRPLFPVQKMLPNVLATDLLISPLLPKPAFFAGMSAEVRIGEPTAVKLKLSLPVSFDTVYGVSWSLDGTKIAFGCADNTLRAIDANTGEQVLFQGAHSDWVLDTTFSYEGQYLISVSRDMSMKLTEVATQRFVDNITSITPGALKGGLLAIARHPRNNELLCGGADGMPKIYKMLRTQERKIGDDFNLIRKFDKMPGRVFDVQWSPDGVRIVAASSLDGKGEVRVFNAADGKPVSTFQGKLPAVYALAYRPDGRAVAAAGFDGVVRFFDPSTGKQLSEFVPVPMK
jgi:WD40 repeat protein/mono/diheme cytochrome c family protein